MSIKTPQTFRRKFARIWRHLDERGRRLVAANEALLEGYGAITWISRACGLSRVTITKGIRDLDENPIASGRIRRPGAGRHKLVVNDPALPAALETLVEPLTRGDPQSPLRWTCKSTRTLAAELTKQNHPVSHVKVAEFLRDMGYSLQGEGADHPNRDAQFRHINEQVRRAMAAGRPVISVDTKKKELVGNYKNKGRQWRKSKAPRAYPYGIYDIARNKGFVNVGTGHATSAFAVASIRGWWRFEGKRLYPDARRLLITTDGGGNDYRRHLWKLELQKLADATSLSIEVYHCPPGTSKWNKVEHRLFSFISSNWRGEPLRDYETTVRLLARTTTAKGLKVSCRLDHHKYPTGRDVEAEEIWNYVIQPRQT